MTDRIGKLVELYLEYLGEKNKKRAKSTLTEILEALRDSIGELNCDFLLETLYEVGGPVQLVSNYDEKWSVRRAILFTNDTHNDNRVSAIHIHIDNEFGWYDTIKEAILGYIDYEYEIE